MTVLDELADRLFADVPEIARITGRDQRTIRAAAEAGQIPATKVGKKYMIPTSWLREQMSQPAAAAPDLDELADQVADRLFARFARMFGAMLNGEPSEAA